MNSPLLQVDGLSKTVVLHMLGGKRVDVLRDISFDLSEGEFLGLAGPSGAGKSSLLKCLYRTYLASAGRALYRRRDGSEVDLLSLDERAIVTLRRAEIGHVAQFLDAAPRVAAVDIVAAPLIDAGVPESEARARAATVLERLGIDASLHSSYPSLFSGGEQQRVNVARALIAPPRLLLLDEPTSALDAANRARVLDLLLEVRAAGTTMIGVFHDAEMLGRLADNVIALDQGRIVRRVSSEHLDAVPSLAAATSESA